MANAQSILHAEGLNDDGRTAKVIVDKSFKKDEAIRKLHFELQEKTYKTLQLGIDKHAFLLDELVYLNHSCNPNVYFKTETMYALKDINSGEELTFFYPSTEWEMREPFECWCKSSNCVKSVQGAKFLSKDILDKFYLSDHIKQLLNKAKQ